MRITSLTSAAAAVVVGLTLFDATPADAAQRGRTVVRKSSPVLRNRTITKRTFTKKTTTFVKKSTIGKGALNLRTIPVRNATAGSQLLSGRLAVPKQVKPKLSLVLAPPVKFRPRFAPFVQRHWKKAFFWVAVAGIGYLTIPQLYYNQFYTCLDSDDPVYDDCLYILSYAAVEEEDYVRVSMPEKAAYRYKATAAPVKDECPSCRWDDFVERRWKEDFSWVRIPDIGNVTVPDTHYERFHSHASANPPNYPRACQVLEQAAAVSGESKIDRLTMPADATYRHEAETNAAQQCRSCTLDRFVERKWNREFVWVQIPQTGNVTVPEETYDSFYRYASAEPPNYPAACKVLTEAAAADTLMALAGGTGLD
jgi:hypothetical protein